MRCVICDVELSEGEISLDHELKSEPCTTCNDIIMETAYSDGFEPDTDNTKHEHSALLEPEIDSIVEEEISNE